MGGFDGEVYERRQHEATGAVATKLLEVIELDDSGCGPVVKFLCPNGHSLKRYRVEQGWRGDLRLVALPGQDAGPSGPVVDNGSPWSGGKKVCDSPGCPELITWDGTCHIHGSVRREVVHHVRSKFTCRNGSCSWPGSTFTHAHLMKVYTLAIFLHRDSIPVTGAAATRRRRRS